MHNILQQWERSAFVNRIASSASVSDIDNYISRTYTAENFAGDLPETKHLPHSSRNEILAGYSKIVPDTMHHSVFSMIALAKCSDCMCWKNSFRWKSDNCFLTKQFSQLQSLNQSGIWLNVWTGNTRAIRFYAKQGFEKAGVTELNKRDAFSIPIT